MRKVYKFNMKKLTGVVGGIRFNDEIAFCDASGFILFVAMFASGTNDLIVGGYRYKGGRMTRHIFMKNEDMDELQAFVIEHFAEIPHTFMEL